MSNYLTPSDQLLALFVVNIILVSWVGLSFTYLYSPHPPDLLDWMYWSEGLVLLSSFLLSLLDTIWPRLKGIAKGVDSATVPPLNLNVTMLKGAVFAVTALNVVILWRLAEETGGVLSPYAPFLPAPAIFVSFVTKKWWTIGGLSIVVTAFIVISTIEVPEPMPDLEVYQGSAAVMVVLAGLLSALQARVASTGQPLTGPSSAEAATPPDPRPRDSEDGRKWPDLDDDDLAPSPEG